MLNKVLLTFSTRTLTAFLSVVNVLIGTNYLGVEGYGTISLVILGITIYLIFQNLLTGSSIIYFLPKISISSIVLMSYAWIIVSIGFFSMLIFGVHHLATLFSWNFEIVPTNYALHTVLLASGYGLMNTHLNILLGKERIKAYNFIFFLQHFLITVFLFIFFVVLKKKAIEFYLIAMYAGYFISYLVSFSLSLHYLKKMTKPKWSEFLLMIKYGLLGQGANIFQLLNYRLSYYLVDIFVGRAALGIFSAATQISEGLWIFGKSIATVQFARISNSDDRDYARKLTLQLFKMTVAITCIPLLILIFLPVEFYTKLLGPDFYSVRSLLRYLALGTISLTASMLMSHYFSGTGRIGKNTIGSGIGVVVTFALGLSLVPIYGSHGAAVVTSISYLSSLIYLFYQFRKDGGLSLQDLLITRAEIREMRKLLLNRFKESK